MKNPNTISSLFHSYLSNVLDVDSDKYKETTKEIYKSHFRKWIEPYIGIDEISSITPLFILEYRKTLKEKGASNECINKVFSLLKRMFTYAVKTLSILQSNPLDGVDILAVKREKKNNATLGEDKVKTLLSLFKEYSPEYLTLFLAYYTGGRASEIFALEWKDIDFDKKTISFSSQLRTFKGQRILLPPKTPSSVRTIHVNELVINELKKYKDYQEEKEKEYGDKYTIEILKENVIDETTKYWKNEKGRVYPVLLYKDGSQFLYTTFSNYTIKKIRKEKGLEDFHLHLLRHENASRLISHGADIASVSRRLGHQNVNITLSVYTHPDLDKDKEVANILGEL